MSNLIVISYFFLWLLWIDVGSFDVWSIRFLPLDVVLFVTLHKLSPHNQSCCMPYTPRPSRKNEPRILTSNSQKTKATWTVFQRYTHSPTCEHSTGTNFYVVHRESILLYESKEKRTHKRHILLCVSDCFACCSQILQ
jgi:hypothetical protein